MAVREAVGSTPGPALDVATGTCDLALELSRAGSVSSVVGLDRTPEMLSVGRRKALERGTSSVSLVAGDAHDLPFSDNRFVCATVGFGVRNYADLDRAMREMVRVVAPGGRVVVLEIVKGRGRLGWGKLFPLLFGYVTPWLGMVLARDREAYTYLPESVRAFHSAAELALVMERSGLRGVKTRSAGPGRGRHRIGHQGRIEGRVPPYSLGLSTSLTEAVFSPSLLRYWTSTSSPTS